MNLEKFGVKELSKKESKEIEGGIWGIALAVILFGVAAYVGYKDSYK